MYKVHIRCGLLQDESRQGGIWNGLRLWSAVTVQSSSCERKGIQANKPLHMTAS